MELKEFKIITPKPFFKISFGCSNRAFYTVKSELYDIANKIGVEIQDGYIEEKCDYEGDLEEIIIYNDQRGKLLVKGVLDFYKVPPEHVPDGMQVALTIF